MGNGGDLYDSSIFEPSPPFQDGLKLTLFKNLIAHGNPDFMSMQQQVRFTHLFCRWSHPFVFPSNYPRIYLHSI